MAEKTKTLTQRRAIILAIIGATPPDSIALREILNNGLLVTIKSWLDELLNVGIGGVDLLLHLLGSIAMLPVTKEMVTTSKLGKLVASVEKHPICLGGMNENAIKERVSKVKEEWSASVKRLKKATSSNPNASTLKRNLDADSVPIAPTKKVKTSNESTTKKSLSSYLSQVSGSTKEESAAEQARRRAEERVAALKERVFKQENSSASSEPVDTISKTLYDETESGGERRRKNVKWADMEGGPLTVSHGHDTQNHSQEEHGAWAEKQKKDRVHEKELLEKAKKSKLDDEDDSLDTMVMMYSTGWHQPLRLPPDNQNPPIQIDSKELNNQMRRVLSTLPATYLSEGDVPSNPTPLTEVEQALDLASQSSTVPQQIPLFAAVPEPAPLAAPMTVPVPAPVIPSFPPPILAPMSNVASAEFVQSLGLPAFLVGQNTQALQTIAASPGLLNAFLDINGNYDQARIMNLVQTVTASIPGALPPPPMPPPPSQHFPPSSNIAQNYGHQYGAMLQNQQFQAPPPPPPQAPFYSVPGSFQSTTNSTDGNLHLSGYGPMTTADMIIQLFSPYVKVEEIVPKNGFMFLNTNDPEGAKRAKEALTGVMVGGGPLRINPAVRRTKNSGNTGKSDAASTSISRPAIPTAPLPRDALGQVDYNAVRDDRGNVATKNLFVAGYGPGTTEQQLKDTFSQFCHVTGIVMKNSFSFVNTAEKKSAVEAREALRGVTVNGGALRINFAKESGRLGTTFDNKASSQNVSHYGHSY